MKQAGCVALAIAVAGCTIPERPRLTASTGNLPAIAAVTITQRDDSSALDAALVDALGTSLAARGIAVVADAEHELSYALALRSSETALAHEDTDSGQVDWLSRPRNGYLLDACRGERVRVTVMVAGKGLDAEPMRAVGEADACKVTEATMARLADRIVGRAVARP